MNSAELEYVYSVPSLVVPLVQCVLAISILGGGFVGAGWNSGRELNA
jgi:hypothetical protein